MPYPLVLEAEQIWTDANAAFLLILALAEMKGVSPGELARRIESGIIQLGLQDRPPESFTAPVIYNRLPN